MNCIIVDDDEMSRSTVQHFVEQTEFLNLKANLTQKCLPKNQDLLNDHLFMK